MKLKLVFATALVAGLGWFALKDSVLTAWMSRGAPLEAASAPDHTSDAGWAIKPGDPPPAVWETGWVTDVFLLPPLASAPLRHGTIRPDTTPALRSQIRRAEALATPLFAIGPVYMPKLRLPSPANSADSADWSLAREDLASALNAYLEQHNKGRAILFAVAPGSEPLLDAVSEVMASGPDELRQRSGGLVVFEALPQDTGALETICSPAVGENCVLLIASSPISDFGWFFAPHLPSDKPIRALDNPVAAGVDIEARRNAVLAYLEENVARMAEPLPGFETIDVAPIRRPGTTRED